MDNYPEYLERNALIEKIQKAYCVVGCKNHKGLRCDDCDIGEVLDIVGDAPADMIDDHLHPMAFWVVQDATLTKFECSRCHTRNHHTRWDYCPSCGAKMENAHG